MTRRSAAARRCISAVRQGFGSHLPSRHASGVRSIAPATESTQDRQDELESAFAAGDQPVNVGQVDAVERPKQWLGRDEPHCGRKAAEVIDRFNCSRPFDANPHPDVRRPLQLVGNARKAKRAFRQDLVGVLRRLFHHRKYVADVVNRHSCMEEVGHAVHEDQPRSLPVPWHVERFGVERHAEAGAGRLIVTIDLVADLRGSRTRRTVADQR
jgi:hypothetical protein